MQYIPIKTRVLEPPEDDLYAVLDESLMDLQDGDLLLIASKVVSIHQGRCVPLAEANKRALVEKEADYFIEGMEKYESSPLALKYNNIFYAAGIDESNADGHYILLPERPYETAQEIWDYLRKKHQLKNLGVILTDSHSRPLRWGCSGISIGHWGFHPVNHFSGSKDLFGRELQYTSIGLVDGVVAGAEVVMGETTERTPLAIARDVPGVRFTETDTRDELLIDPEDDIYYPLLKPFYESSAKSEIDEND